MSDISLFSVAVSIYIVLQDLLFSDYYIADMDKMLIKQSLSMSPSSSHWTSMQLAQCMTQNMNSKCTLHCDAVVTNR